MIQVIGDNRNGGEYAGRKNHFGQDRVFFPQPAFNCLKAAKGRLTVNSNDKQLSELLARWTDIHPRPAFAPDVLRRIRLEVAQSQTPVQNGWVAWFESPRRLAWATGCACALTLAVGVLTSLTPPAPAKPPSSRPALNFAFLDRGSLAGNYLALTGGQQP